MESKDLLHPENDENQNHEVNSGASQEGQNNTATDENQTVESSQEPNQENVNSPQTSEEDIVEEKPTDYMPEATAEEAGSSDIPGEVEATPVETQINEPEQLAAEEKQPGEIPENSVPVVDEPASSQMENTTVKVNEPINKNQSVSDMMADIEDTQNQNRDEEDEEGAEEKVSEEDSIEKMESDYADLNLDQAVEELLVVVAEPDYNKIKQRVGILKAKILQLLKIYKQEQLEAFVNDGGNKDEFVPETSVWETKLNEALHTFKEKKNKYIEQLEAEKQRNLEQKQAIINGLRDLIEQETNLKNLNDQFKVYQEQWKSIGPVPQNESTNLWQNYHFYVEKFFDILRINKELRYLDLKKNMELKIKLCETAESLLLQDSVNNSFKVLQQLHDEWKEIGPVPEDKKEEIWERFKNASDQINARRREYYDKLYAEQQNNYNAKVVLCEQAEELIAEDIQSIKQYNEVSDKMTELLKVWKTLGPAPSKLNDDIWMRFKSTLDKFFQSKKEYFQQMKDTQMQNYNLKLNIALQAEGIAIRTDWKQATEEMLKLQKEWKEIGPIPRKYSDALWKRFRSACDKFFETKSHYFSNIQQIETENLEKKEALIRKIAEHQFGDDKGENLEVMKAYQREWTELGHVPKKDKDRIYNEYREVINKRFADLKMSVDDVRKDHYKNRIDTILNNPNADRLLDKEKRFLTNKLNQLKEDIILWENNLGFFAQSKNADILKAEFSKKIDAAKEQVKELEYKLKMMSLDAKAKKKAEEEQQQNINEAPATEEEPQN